MELVTFAAERHSLNQPLADSTFSTKGPILELPFGDVTYSSFYKLLQQSLDDFDMRIDQEMAFVPGSYNFAP
jgi:hypothetical protein